MRSKGRIRDLRSRARRTESGLRNIAFGTGWSQERSSATAERDVHRMPASSPVAEGWMRVSVAIPSLRVNVLSTQDRRAAEKIDVLHRVLTHFQRSAYTPS